MSGKTIGTGSDSIESKPSGAKGRQTLLWRVRSREGSSETFAFDGTYSNHGDILAPTAHAWNVWTRQAESGRPE